MSDVYPRMMAQEPEKHEVATTDANGTDASMEACSALVVSNPPAGPNPEASAKLAAAWRDMEEKMDSLARMSRGKDYDPNLKPQDVMSNLEAIKDSQRRKVENWGRVRQVFNNSLTVISNVGGMVADAASQVFAPAGQCYNAINFVINAYKSYASIFDSLQEAFAKCTEFLGRLEKYAQGKMSVSLCNVACDMLRQYVEICETALKMRSSYFFKIRMVTSITFLGDNKFDGFMATLKSITEREELERGADIYLNTSKALDTSTSMMNWMENDKNEREGAKQQKSDRDTVLQALSFDKTPETWDGHTQTPIATWTSTYHNIRQKYVEGTGQWIFREHLFDAWRKKKGDAPPVLGIVGGPSSGKSYLASTIISYLRGGGDGQQVESRQPVAFFFRDERKSNSGIKTLGKAIIWQFAKNDASYMQSAAATCKGYIEPTKLLTKLLLENHKELQAIDATFYIVINKIGDGKGDVPEWVLKFLKDAMQRSNKTVRVLFTASPETVAKLRNHDLKCPTIDMEKNEEDRYKYIDMRMDDMDVLRDTEDPSILKLRETIRTRLSKETEGNYNLIDKVLNEISTKDVDTDIYNALDGAKRSLAEYLEDDRKKLNQSLSPPELAEINEMILWIGFAREPMTAEKMKAVLQNVNGATALTSFEDRLRKKFLLFEIDNDGIVNFRSEQILATIPERARTAKNRQRDNKQVQSEEVTIVQHFLNTVCPPKLIEKLELKEHFQTKLKPQEEQIYQEDRNNAHFRLAKACLRALASWTTAKIRILRGYAVRNLIYHMSEVDLTLIDPELKRSVGPDLLNLFLNVIAIDNLLWANKPLPHLPEWMLDVDSVKYIKRWLEDISPDPEGDTKKQSWLKAMSGEAAITKTLTEPSVVRMAYYCFQEESDPDLTSVAYQIVRNFLSKFDMLSNSDQQETTQSETVEAWCQEKLQVRTRDSLWHCQMAYVLDSMNAGPQVEARCRKALDIDPKNWRASLLLAQKIESNSESIEILRKLIKKQFGSPLPPKETMEKSKSGALADMAYTRGERNWMANQRDKAQKWFANAIQYGPDKHEHTLKILGRYQSANCWKDIVDVIEMIHSQSQLAPLVLASLDQGPESPKFDKIILDAVAATKKFHIIDNVYQGAIKSASKSKNYLASFKLRQAYANALSARRPVPMEQVRQQLEDAARDVPFTNLDMARAFFDVGYRLGTIYLDKAKQAKEAKRDKEAEDYLGQLAAVKPEQVSEDQMRLPLRLFAARYYHVYGNEVRAQRSVHNTLRMAIELLSDNDSSNDLLAYMKILFAVIPFGDEDNATAALSLMMREMSTPLKCACGCGHEWTTFTEIWWCQDCINVPLTAKCKDTIENEKETKRTVCGPGHKHFSVSGWEGMEPKKGSKEVVPWRGEFISIDKWRKNLTKKYNLAK
ncbi:hypothetical protein BDV59DRAFT_16615 [Aspergillus ambiguus]|uniref:uncharacterized protein n=1 Tax=Aspergillus ambiguus TaxID=176160 RepID=UPI003CCCA8B8